MSREGKTAFWVNTALAAAIVAVILVLLGRLGA